MFYVNAALCVGMYILVTSVDLRYVLEIAQMGIPVKLSSQCVMGGIARKLRTMQRLDAELANKSGSLWATVSMTVSNWTRKFKFSPAIPVLYRATLNVTPIDSTYRAQYNDWTNKDRQTQE